MRGDTPRTISIGFDGRAQTNQDFVIGIGVFILAVAFVFTMVPDIVGVYSASSDSGDVAQVDRVAGTIVDHDDLETDTPNELDSEVFVDEFATDEDFNETLGLRATDDHRFDQINVTVERLERAEGQPQPLNTSDGEAIAVGPDYEGQSAVTATRIVTVTDLHDDDPIDEGEPARLVVRMW